MSGYQARLEALTAAALAGLLANREVVISLQALERHDTLKERIAAAAVAMAKETLLHARSGHRPAPEARTEFGPVSSLKELKLLVERRCLEDAVRLAPSKAAAARRLGVSQRTLWNLLRRHDLALPGED